MTIDYKEFPSNFEIWTIAEEGEDKDLEDRRSIDIDGDTLLYYSPDNFNNYEDAVADFRKDIIEELKEKFGENVENYDEFFFLISAIMFRAENIIEYNFTEEDYDTYRVGWEDLENEEHIDYWDYKESEMELAEAKFDSIELEKGQRKYILHLGKVEILKEDYK